MGRTRDLRARDLELIQRGLEGRVASMAGEGCPPKLAGALRQAVLGAGHRLRPRICLAVAEAQGATPEPLALQAAVALELVHCASLVHDDLPAFDDAATRRGAPSVHAAFGEEVAILAGDALIIGAFALLGDLAAAHPVEAGRLVALLGRSTGTPRGITAGQGWESEPEVGVEAYHQAKTAALFEAATMAGAIAAGDEPERWRALGRRLGLIYQLADDIRDAVAAPEDFGKPVGRDEALGRPSAVRAFGLEAALDRFDAAAAAVIAAAPPCPGRAELLRFIEGLLDAFRPRRMR